MHREKNAQNVFTVHSECTQYNNERKLELLELCISPTVAFKKTGLVWSSSFTVKDPDYVVTLLTQNHKFFHLQHNMIFSNHVKDLNEKLHRKHQAMNCSATTLF